MELLYTVGLVPWRLITKIIVIVVISHYVININYRTVYCICHTVISIWF